MKATRFASISILTVMCASASESGGEAISFQGLGDLPGDEFFSWAFNVSGDGLVAVGSSKSSHGEIAFRWTSLRGVARCGGMICTLGCNRR